MQPKLKEDPREWRKFLLLLALFGTGLAGWLAWRARLSVGAFQGIAAVLAVALAAGLTRPRWIRPVYRVVMTASFHVGQVVGRILLALFFLLLLTPLALVLKLFGQDALRLRRDPKAQTYWRTAKPPGPLDRGF